MTPDAQRVAIAEACGFEVLRAAGTAKAMVREQLCTGAASTDWRMMPDYLNDLNACHEMEKVMTQQQRGRYSRHLSSILSKAASNTGEYDIWHATAAQRCEAFLRTLGLWHPEAAQERQRQGGGA